MARREKADIEAIIQLVDPGPVFASFTYNKYPARICREKEGLFKEGRKEEEEEEDEKKKKKKKIQKIFLEFDFVENKSFFSI